MVHTVRVIAVPIQEPSLAAAVAPAHDAAQNQPQRSCRQDPTGGACARFNSHGAALPDEGTPSRRSGRRGRSGSTSRIPGPRYLPPARERERISAMFSWYTFIPAFPGVFVEIRRQTSVCRKDTYTYWVTHVLEYHAPSGGVRRTLSMWISCTLHCCYTRSGSGTGDEGRPSELDVAQPPRTRSRTSKARKSSHGAPLRILPVVRAPLIRPRIVNTGVLAAVNRFVDLAAIGAAGKCARQGRASGEPRGHRGRPLRPESAMESRACLAQSRR